MLARQMFGLVTISVLLFSLTTRFVSCDLLLDNVPLIAQQSPATILVVTSAADSGSGTLRQALHDARRGDTIIFDPEVFPPSRPTTIAVTSGLPEISQGRLTIDGSNAGVILDGSGIGRRPETLLLDDISLKVDGGPNLISNGDFSSGSVHWRPWDDAPGATRHLRYSDYHSSPQSYEWTTVAQVGESHLVYDTNSTSYPFPNRAYYWPYYRESTVWIPLVSGETVELSLWYRYGGFSVWLNALFSDGHMENIHSKWFDRMEDWTKATTSQTIPSGVIGIALELGFSHSEQWVNGLSIRSSENIIRGLQIINFPGSCIALYGGARNNIIGGDRNIGAGPLGQGNLISGEGNFGIGLWDLETSFNTIQGNYIGTDLSGTVSWGKLRDGIHINGPHHNKVIDNLICGNLNGVYIGNNNESYNTFVGNRIGTDLNGILRLGNRNSGIVIDRASCNVIGPNNIIAFNGGHGIGICSNSMRNTIVQNRIHDNNGNGISVRSYSLHNTFIRNSIYNNSGTGIWLCDFGNEEITPPMIIDFDLRAGTALGVASPNCFVEIFSDSNDEGAIYEGRTKSDDTGFFLLDKGASFSGPRLTATVTDEDGDTSKFSSPTGGQGISLCLQDGNDLHRRSILTKWSYDIDDNRIGVDLSYGVSIGKETLLRIGLKWVRFAYDGLGNPLNWQNVEKEKGNYAIDPEVETFISSLADNGVSIMLNLGVGTGEDRPDYTRFSSKEEIERYANYVRFVVSHFKGRVKYYELWNEPDTDTPWGGISVDNYANLIKLVVPIIRMEDPDAKIVVGATGGQWASGYEKFSRYTLHIDYLKTLLRSGVAPLVDAISWHPFHGNRPDDQYYKSYPQMVQEIMGMAASHGFKGEYLAEEIEWPSNSFHGDGTMSTVTERVAAKYLARAIITHLGLNVTVSAACQSDQSGFSARVIRALCTIMAGARIGNFSADIESDATNIMSYSFILPNGDRLIALWTDGLAVEDDYGVHSTLIIDGTFNEVATCIDVLHGFEQDLIKNFEDGKTTIRNLLVKDYPIIIRLSSARTSSACRTLAISTLYSEVSAKTGRTLYFPMAITNIATNDLTFNLSFISIPEGWNLSFRKTPGDPTFLRTAFLEAGESALFYLEAIPPRNAGVGTYNFTIEVEPKEGICQNLTFTANITGFYELALEFSTLYVKVRPGEITMLTATMNNVGPTRLSNVTLDVSAPSGWQVTLMPNYIDELAPGSFGSIMLQLKSPSNTDIGEYVIGIRSISGCAESPQLLLRVNVQSSPISSWVIGAIPMLAASAMIFLVYLKFARKK